MLLEARGIFLNAGDVYSIEGANQAGKSTLISAIMGVYGSEGRRSKAASLTIEIIMSLEGVDRPPFRSPSEAARAGVAAVFQDDELIATLTVREQLLLRHSLRGLPALLAWTATKLTQKAEDLRDFAIRIREYQNRILPSMPTILSSKEVSEEASRVLARISKISGVDYNSVLDKRPIELSGGAIAVARLISTLITPNLKLLFLDEAFRGIQADVWPYLVDALKAIAKDKGITIVAVSHNRDEIVRWQPTGRFAISDGVLSQIEPKNHSGLVPAIELGPEFYPVYTINRMSSSQWAQVIRGYTVIIVDRALEQHPQFSEIVARIDVLSPGRRLVVSLEGGETNKGFDKYSAVIAQLCGTLTEPIGTFVIVGGGVVLNLGGFVAATIDRGSGSLVLVPTTIMAMADVAVGSKTGVNFADSSENGSSRARKHGIGVYRNPDAVLLDDRFLSTLTRQEVNNGIAECLKHGLCQSTSLYNECLDLISRGGDQSSAFDIARRVMTLKAQLLSVDPCESGIGRILQFGHLHAHALERAISFRISHGFSVYWGLLVQCVLSGTESANGNSASIEIAGAIRAARIFEGWSMSVTSNQLVSFYEGDSKLYHRSIQTGLFRTLFLPEVGLFENIYEFRTESSVSEYVKDIAATDLVKAIDAARKLLDV